MPAKGLKVQPDEAGVQHSSRYKVFIYVYGIVTVEIGEMRSR